MCTLNDVLIESKYVCVCGGGVGGGGSGFGSITMNKCDIFSLNNKQITFNVFPSIKLNPQKTVL